MDWDKLRVFHAVAEAGSFTHAGTALNLSQSTVSRQVSALEEGLHTALFHRHARGLVLTEQGRVLHQTVREFFAKLALTEATLSETKEAPAGQLKVTATVALGSTWLAPRIKEFIDLYPAMSVVLLLDDQEMDLSVGAADVALRMRQPTQADLVYRRLLSVHYHVYAATGYLQNHGTPKSLSDLERHRLIVFGAGTPLPIANIDWAIRAGGGKSSVRPTLQINNILGMKLAVQSGLGIAALPDYIVHGSNDIERVLPEVKYPAFDMYFVYPQALRRSKRIAVFRDFLIGKIKESSF